MSVKTLLSDDEKYIGNTYKRLPIDIAKAKGSYLYDKKGKKYLDMLTGIAVHSLGHNHPVVKKALLDQSASYLHLSNYFADKNQVSLAKLIVSNSFADKVFYVNTGTEANETAIKLARKWARKNKHPKAHEIITMKNSFHGRSMGSLSITGQPQFHKDIGPMMGGVKTVAYNDISAVKNAITKKTAAVIVEPVQCESGVNIPFIDYLTQLRNLTKKHNILLIVDEIQTGLGRTGKFLCCEHSLIQPDIVTLGKSLGAGLPLSALITTNEIAESFTCGDHGTTMGGNPLAAAIGYAELKHVLDKKLISASLKTGEIIKKKLYDLEKKYNLIGNIRGLGLILAFDIEEAELFMYECLKNGLIVNKLKSNSIRLLPPLNISPSEIKAAFLIIEKVLKSHKKKLGN